MINIRRSQQFFSETITPTEKFLNNPSKYLKSLLVGSRKVLSKFIAFGRGCKSIFFSQEYLANACGLRRETVNRMIREFDDMGLIAKNYRAFQFHESRTSEYRVASVLITPPPEI